MTANCPARRRIRRRLSGRARARVGLALVAFALLGAPPPSVAAQPPPRPEPRELWQQFPLDAKPSEPVGRAQAGPMPSATTPATDSGGAEVHSLSFSMVQIGAIVAATALVLLLLAGVLAYSARGPLGFAIRRHERRPARPFRNFVEERRTDRGAGRPDGTVTAARRPAKHNAEATLHAVGVAAVDAYARIGSEVGRLIRQASARTMPSNEPPTAIEGVGTLGDRIEEYAGERKTRMNAASQVPKVDPDRHRAPLGSLADDELEILKAKLGKPAALAGDERVNEVETLKAKLRDDPVRKKGARTAPNLLKRKLEERRIPQKAGARAAADVESPSGKPKPRKKPRSDVPESSGVGTRGAASAVRAKAAAPLGLVPSPSQKSDRPVLEEPLQSGNPLGIKCRILWWRGYIGSMFYALARTPGGEEYIVAESPHFRWSKSHAPPNDSPAVEAHRSLVETLEREGWSVAGTGEHWFMLEFEHRQARRRPGSRGGQTG
jgi:hypothetical protein